MIYPEPLPADEEYGAKDYKAAAVSLADMVKNLQPGQGITAIGAPPDEQIHCVFKRGAARPEIGGYISTSRYKYRVYDLE